MSRVKYFLGVIIVVGLVFNSAVAQQAEVEWQYNENSVDPIPKYESTFQSSGMENHRLVGETKQGFFRQGR